jgi:hypothetical protein
VAIVSVDGLGNGFGVVTHQRFELTQISTPLRIAGIGRGHMGGTLAA